MGDLWDPEFAKHPVPKWETITFALKDPRFRNSGIQTFANHCNSGGRDKKHVIKRNMIKTAKGKWAYHAFVNKRVELVWVLGPDGRPSNIFYELDKKMRSTWKNRPDLDGAGPF